MYFYLLNPNKILNFVDQNQKNTQSPTEMGHYIIYLNSTVKKKTESLKSQFISSYPEDLSR